MHALTAFVVHLIGQAGYAGLFIAMTLGNVGAPVGTEVVLPVAGALAATGHLRSVWLTIAIALVAELLGQSIGYAIGFFGGRPLIERYGKYIRFHEAELDRVHNFFERWGSFAIFICRFTPVIRGIVGIAAGIARMPLPAFYLWTFLGSLGFCGGLILLGSAFGAHINAITPILQKFGVLLALLVVVVDHEQ